MDIEVITWAHRDTGIHVRAVSTDGIEVAAQGSQSRKIECYKAHKASQQAKTSPTRMSSQFHNVSSELHVQTALIQLTLPILPFTTNKTDCNVRRRPVARAK
jgi:hypothetical protein